MRGDGVLPCPKCGKHYLHQEEVEIGWRIEDEAAERIVSSFRNLLIDQVPAREVKYGCRRDYLIIRFSCENCPETSLLGIWQQKGNTILEWL